MNLSVPFCVSVIRSAPSLRVFAFLQGQGHIALPFGRTRIHAFDELSLKHEVECDGGDKTDDGGGEDEAVIRRILRGEAYEARRQGTPGVRLQGDQRQEVVVPTAHEAEHDEGESSRFRQWQHHAPEDTELGAAVHPGGVRDLRWQ